MASPFWSKRQFMLKLGHSRRSTKNAAKNNIANDLIVKDVSKQSELEELTHQLTKHLYITYDLYCIAIICDEVYLNLFTNKWFRYLDNLTVVMIVVRDSEDLLSPNYKTLESIRLVRQNGCKLYIIFLSNGVQASRLLKFGDRYRVLDTRAKYIMIHDFRLFRPDIHYIWRRITNVAFLRHYVGFHKDNLTNSWFEISTAPYPSLFNGVFIPQRVTTWKYGKKLNPSNVFKEKSINLKGNMLNIVVYDHIPAVIKYSNEKSYKYSGIETKIIQALSKVMNFVPNLYEASNSKVEKWGHKKLNGTFSGLLGEMVAGKADMALANLHYTPYHLQLTDLTIPYISQCLTFLTPESQTDNSWKTLILPFKLQMWIAVLVVLIMSGFLFYGLAKFHENLTRSEATKKIMGLYVFGELTNSILYTYGMLLVISLPKLPPNWSIRLLTGWYWLYCVLVVVSYRASMTAILANPAPKVTIDTMQQLAESNIACGGWGEQTREFFFTSLDEISQKIGDKFLTINDVNEGVKQVSEGLLAYYDNIYFLKYISAEKKNRANDAIKNGENEDNNKSNETSLSPQSNNVKDRSLHIMKECAIHMPISIGLQKNSPLKPRCDKLLRRIIEAGLIEKWLNDVMVPIISTMQLGDNESVKALMNLQKLYGGFVTLGIGYFLSTLSFIGELIHWNFVIKKDPLYDKYAMNLYYANKKIAKVNN